MKKIELLVFIFGIIGLTVTLSQNKAIKKPVVDTSSEANLRQQRILNTIKDASAQAPPERKLLWPIYNPYLMSSAYSHLMMNPMAYSLGHYMNPLYSMMMNPMYSMMMMNPMYSMMMMNPMYSMMMNPMMGMYNPMMWGMMGGMNNNGGNNMGANQRQNRKLFTDDTGKVILQSLLPQTQQELNSVESQSQNGLDDQLSLQKQNRTSMVFKDQ